MSKGRVILDESQFALTIDRLCYQIIEDYNDFDNFCIVGIQERGVLLSDRIIERLQVVSEHKESIDYGKLDITFHRDDFRRRDVPISPSTTELDFLVEDRDVLLIDDVLYTGRTIQAAMAALGQFGRPRSVKLLSLVDRRFNRHLPIQADYIGLTVDGLNEAYVRVEWEGINKKDQIKLFLPEKG